MRRASYDVDLHSCMSAGSDSLMARAAPTGVADTASSVDAALQCQCNNNNDKKLKHTSRSITGGEVGGAAGGALLMDDGFIRQRKVVERFHGVQAQDGGVLGGVTQQIRERTRARCSKHTSGYAVDMTGQRHAASTATPL